MARVPHPKQKTIYDHFKFPSYSKKEYPKMLYHPEGKLRQVTPGEEQMTMFGPKLRNVHYELEHKVVNTKQEELEALKAGWHLSPSDAKKAAAKLEKTVA